MDKVKYFGRFIGILYRDLFWVYWFLMLTMGIISVHLMNDFLMAFIAGGILIFVAMAGTEIRIGRSFIFEEAFIFIMSFIGSFFLIIRGLEPLYFYLISPVIMFFFYLVAKYLLGVHKRAKQEARREME